MPTDEILDPPGTIAILGGGILGLEAALYARFLGYDVTVFEALDVGQSWLDAGDADLSFLPGRGISGLALEAIRAQHDDPQTLETLPTTAAGYAEQILRPLAEVDLLSGRVLAGHRVREIHRLPNPEDPAELDFQIRCADRETAWTAEAVIDTAGWASQQAPAQDPQHRWADTPYFHILDGRDSTAATQEGKDDWEQRSVRGRDAIRRLFAMWGDREGLDLYRPTRL